MQQTVRLLDDLGERYGSEHVYCNLRSPAEAIKLLCINHPPLQKELVEAHQHGVAYTLVQAGTFLGYEDLHLPLGSNDLVLTPVIAGSGGNATPIFIGVGLIAASFLFPGAGLFGTVGLFGAGQAVVGVSSIAVLNAAAVGTALSAIGASLILSGVSQMLAPQPTIPSLQNRTAPGENTNASGPQGVSRATSGQQSYAFSGPANTVGVGATVPLVYGKLLVGSHLISSKIEVTSESDPTSEFFITPGGKTITINGEKVGNKFEALGGVRARRYKDKQVKIGNYSDGSIVKRRKTDKVVLFDSKEKHTINDELDSRARTSPARKNLQIFIEINKGLSRVIGDQTVPAFVTYEITVKKDGLTPTFANVRVTAQGLLRESDSYKYCHAIAYGHSGEEDDDTTIIPAIRIIDTDADAGQQLVVRGVGYNHFFTDSENRTAGLSET